MLLLISFHLPLFQKGLCFSWLIPSFWLVTFSTALAAVNHPRAILAWNQLVDSSGTGEVLTCLCSRWLEWKDPLISPLPGTLLVYNATNFVFT